MLIRKWQSCEQPGRWTRNLCCSCISNQLSARNRKQRKHESPTSWDWLFRGNYRCVRFQHTGWCSASEQAMFREELAPTRNYWSFCASFKDPSLYLVFSCFFLFHSSQSNTLCLESFQALIFIYLPWSFKCIYIFAAELALDRSIGRW